jgi:ubiquinone/menaquinone biosynthesis C-methylase UbiE
VSTFDERAGDWDSPERIARAAAVADAIRARVALTPTTRTIDVGAGTGLLGLALADEVGDLVLADPSEGMLGVVREKLSGGRWPRVSAARFDLTVDERPGAPFDLAISLMVLHHVADTHAAFAALSLLLRPGGVLAVADLDTEDGSFHRHDAEGIHHRGFDRGSITAIARAAGFVDVSLGTATELDRDGRRYPAFLLVARRP